MQILNETLLDRIRNLPCCFCGAAPPSEAMHTFSRGMGGGARLDHPLAVNPGCRQCHAWHHAGEEPKVGTLVAIAAQREGWTIKAAWEELYRLRREKS